MGNSVIEIPEPEMARTLSSPRKKSEPKHNNTLNTNRK